MTNLPAIVHSVPTVRSPAANLPAPAIPLRALVPGGKASVAIDNYTRARRLSDAAGARLLEAVDQIAQEDPETAKDLINHLSLASHNPRRRVEEPL
jgi:hypothetical protein